MRRRNGLLLYPNGLGAPDHLNNVEGIDIPTTSSGTYTIIVQGYNVPNGPQPYALVLREDALVVPEPVALPLLCLGVGWCLRRRRRHV